MGVAASVLRVRGVWQLGVRGRRLRGRAAPPSVAHLIQAWGSQHKEVTNCHSDSQGSCQGSWLVTAVHKNLVQKQVVRGCQAGQWIAYLDLGRRMNGWPGLPSWPRG